MRILLDTCEFLWLVAGDAKLPALVAARLFRLSVRAASRSFAP